MRTKLNEEQIEYRAQRFRELHGLASHERIDPPELLQLFLDANPKVRVELVSEKNLRYSEAQAMRESGHNSSEKLCL